MSMQPSPNTKLKAAREARGWTSYDAAHLLDIDALVYANWEKGIAPREHNIGKLCRLLRKTRVELGF